MRAVPHLQIVLGPETRAEGHAFAAPFESFQPIGTVTIALDGAGMLSLQSTDPDVLEAMASHFLQAAVVLLGADGRWSITEVDTPFEIFLHLLEVWRWTKGGQR